MKGVTLQQILTKLLKTILTRSMIYLFVKYVTFRHHQAKVWKYTKRNADVGRQIQILTDIRGRRALDSPFFADIKCEQPIMLATGK